jgi:hypothetical protein
MQDIEIEQWFFELQDRTADPTHLAVVFCHMLVCPLKDIVGINYLAYF